METPTLLGFNHGMTSLLTTRQIRLLLVHSRRWQRRSIFIVGGLVVGLMAVALAELSDLAQHAFLQAAERWFFAPLVVTLLGFALAACLASTVFRNTQGSGIPQA